MFVWRNQINYEPNNFPAVVGLVSVILVLLLIFYISSTQVSMPGTTVKLPQMDQVTNHTHAKKLIVTVTGDSEFFFNGKKVAGFRELKPSAGRIQLQSEGFGIEYRNIVLEPAE